MQRMSWLLSQHVLAYRIDSHSMDLADKIKNQELAEWELSLYQAVESKRRFGSLFSRRTGR